MDNENKITQEENFELIQKFFSINEEIEIEEFEVPYLENLGSKILELIESYGEEEEHKIQEEILDDLINRQYKDLILYLGLQFDENIEIELEKQLKNAETKIEENEVKTDFFQNVLKDETINDLVWTLKGRTKRSDGAKEVFLKEASAKIPNTCIDAIGSTLLQKFNKIEFMSEKSDEENAEILLMVYDVVAESVLELDYQLCNADESNEIMGIVATKLTNSIGLNLKKDLLETMRHSFKANHTNSENGQGQSIEQ